MLFTILNPKKQFIYFRQLSVHFTVHPDEHKIAGRTASPPAPYKKIDNGVRIYYKMLKNNPIWRGS